MTTSSYEKHETILEIKNVSLRYGSSLILRDVDATVQNIVRPGVSQGQVICFLGPSGIGKTQLARIISGLQPPSAGQILIGSDLRPVHVGLVGFVPQDYPLFEFATVEENLWIAGRLLPPAEQEERIQTLVDEFGVTSYLKLYPRSLSGGTRQRVAIIRQLLCSDHFIIMDEPFSGLDVINKKRACDLVLRVSLLDELNTLIIITHDIANGMSIADRVWLMGQEPDPERPSEYLPGARLVEDYDLAALDLCWRPDITDDPRFKNLVQQIEHRFFTLRKA